MKDYTECVKALRYCMAKEDGITICESCSYHDKGIDCENVLHTDAAAAIEALQAQLPKWGKWIRIDKHTIQCPLCHRYLDLRGINAGRGDANYCPNCGAKMEVQE